MILKCNYFYVFLIICVLLYCFIYLNLISHNSKLNSNMNNFTGIITNIKTSGDLLTLEVEGLEKIIGNYYFKTLDEKNSFINKYKLGDTIFIEGTFSRANNNTVFNLFNYKKYLERKGIYYLISINNLEKVKDNKNYFYYIKNKVIGHVNNYQSKNYLHTFLLGNNDLLDYDVLNAYQENGVSHLLAISGMHVSLLSGMILFLFKKFKLRNNISYFITVLFLFFFIFLSGSSASVSRSVVLFSLLWLNKLFKLEIKTIHIFIIVFCILVIINPNILFDVGFEFSFIISFYLILLKDRMRNDSYFKSLLKVSMISFLVSLPISLYYFYQINILSIIFNLVFVPLVSFIIFPFSIITFFIPLLDSILLVLIEIMEKLSYLCNQISYFKVVFMKPSILWIILYYLFITLFLYKGKKLGIILIGVLLFIQYFNLVIFPKNFLLMIDVGQGDSILIHLNNKTTLIDIGGKISFSREKWQKRKNKSLTDTTLVPLFKSLGIRKLDYLISSHGDYDHMGEAINLVNNFKVEKVIFNCGEFNELELELIKVLDKKKIPYYSCIKELNIDNNKLYFLNNKDYGNENDNSSIIYTELDNHKFLFMGDAGVEVEHDLIEKYNLQDIDVLKVGHHGSRTSSSKNFIDETTPKYSIISVGKNNRYGHPNKEVLNILKNSKVYRTDEVGSIMFKIKNNNLRIETCNP